MEKKYWTSKKKGCHFKPLPLNNSRVSTAAIFRCPQHGHCWEDPFEVATLEGLYYGNFEEFFSG